MRLSFVDSIPWDRTPGVVRELYASFFWDLSLPPDVCGWVGRPGSGRALHPDTFGSQSRYEQHKALSILCQRLTAAQKKDDVAQEKHRKARRAIRGAEVDTWMLLRNPKIYTKAMTGKWSRPTSAASSSQSLSTKPSAVHFYSPRSRSPSP